MTLLLSRGITTVTSRNGQYTWYLALFSNGWSHLHNFAPWIWLWTTRYIGVSSCWLLQMTMCYCWSFCLGYNRMEKDIIPHIFDRENLPDERSFFSRRKIVYTQQHFLSIDNVIYNLYHFSISSKAHLVAVALIFLMNF